MDLSPSPGSLADWLRRWGPTQGATISGVHARRVVKSVLIAVGLCTWCGWTSAFHRFTMPARAAWAASLAAVVFVDVLLWCGQRGSRVGLRLPAARQEWPPPGSHPKRSTLAGISPWLAVALVVLGWELLGLDTGAREPHLTISALAQAFRPLNAVLLLVWMLVGVGYGAARARAPSQHKTGESAARVTKPTSSSGVALAFVRHPVLTPALLLGRSRAAGMASALSST